MKCHHYCNSSEFVDSELSSRDTENEDVSEVSIVCDQITNCYHMGELLVNCVLRSLTMFIHWYNKLNHCNNFVTLARMLYLSVI